MNIYDDTPETAPKTPTKTSTTRTARTHSDYQKARTQYRQHAKNHHNPNGPKGEPCWICGQPIDYTLKFPHPQSWSLDHAIPIKHNPRLMLEPNNFRSAHLHCNNNRGTDTPAADLGQPSENW